MGSKFIYEADNLHPENSILFSSVLLRAIQTGHNSAPFTFPILKKVEDYEKDKKNPDILNYLGYSLRKTGNLVKAETFYLEGLKLDAGHLGINEYLGELYVQTGRIELAMERLEVLNGCKCEEYDELKELIEKN